MMCSTCESWGNPSRIAQNILNRWGSLVSAFRISATRFVNGHIKGTPASLLIPAPRSHDWKGMFSKSSICLRACSAWCNMGHFVLERHHLISGAHSVLRPLGDCDSYAESEPSGCPRALESVAVKCMTFRILIAPMDFASQSTLRFRRTHTGSPSSSRCNSARQSRSAYSPSSRTWKRNWWLSNSSPSFCHATLRPARSK